MQRDGSGSNLVLSRFEVKITPSSPLHHVNATFYAWARLPKGRGSEDFVMDLIQSHGIISTPGNGFGHHGEGYVRFTLCSDLSVLKQVAEVLKASV